MTFISIDLQNDDDSFEFRVFCNSAHRYNVIDSMPRERDIDVRILNATKLRCFDRRNHNKNVKTNKISSHIIA